MKRLPFKRQLIILGFIFAALCVAIPVAAFAKSTSGASHHLFTNPVSGGALTSGKPVNGVVSTPDGISYTFTAVTNKHVTLSITNPQVSPSGTDLQMNVYDSSGNADVSTTYISTSATETDFTPTVSEAGTTTVVISPYNTGTTGSFTLTYAKDITGKLTSGVAVTRAIKIAGQHVVFTFTAVTNQHLTLSITHPHVSPTGTDLQMNVYDSSGNADVSTTYISTSPTEADFTPTINDAGLTTVVISPYNFETTGSFTLTYALDITGALTSGIPVTGTLLYAGQHADYTFTAVTNQHITLAITNPLVSPSGTDLQMNVYDSSGNADVSTTYISTSPTEADFTPTASEAGLTTVVISPYNFETTGSFTLTYAKDITGKLTSGVPVTKDIKIAGQHADFTFTAVAGVTVTLSITNPHVSPTGTDLQMNVYDSSGNADASTAYISTSPVQIVFTPTSSEAGPTTVIISPYNFETTGSFTLTYTAG